MNGYPAKYERNIAGRGLSFELASELEWETALTVEDMRPDKDNPEWTPADMANARPAADVLPELIAETAAQELLRRGRGRPQKAVRKVNQTLRIDPDVLEAYRHEGKGWQTRINQVLRDNMPRHS